jgi:hypothetical protein
MDDKQKIWTTVGSAGILNAVDLAKVSLHQSIIQLGIAIAPPATQAATATLAAAAPSAASQLGVGFPTVQAVARYNVTPVDGLFFQQVSSAPFHYGLKLRYLGHVTAKLKEVDIVTGSEVDLVLFDSTTSSSFFEVKKAFAAQFEGILDFVKKAYYVEATLVAPALIAGHPAAISIIQVIAEQPSF